MPMHHMNMQKSIHGGASSCALVQHLQSKPPEPGTLLVTTALDSDEMAHSEPDKAED